MTKLPQTRISAVVRNEEELEALVNDLIEKAVARHEISVQGDPFDIKKVYGKSYVDPDTLQHNAKTPKKEPFFSDDFGWILGFAFSLPTMIGAIIGIFLIGDLFSVSDNLVYGSLGALIGAALGITLSYGLKKHRENTTKKQEKAGGFVLWIQVNPEEDVQHILRILKKHGAVHIEKQ